MWDILFPRAKLIIIKKNWRERSGGGAYDSDTRLVLTGLCHGVSYRTVSTPSGPGFGAYISVATKNLLLHFLHHLGQHQSVP